MKLFQRQNNKLDNIYLYLFFEITKKIYIKNEEYITKYLELSENNKGIFWFIENRLYEKKFIKNIKEYVILYFSVLKIRGI